MVMPLWDDNPLKLPRPPLVTWGLIAANVAFYLLTVLAPAGDAQAVVENFALIPANITATPINVTRVPPYVTLVTSMFLHANIWHLAGNMIFLWVFGDDVEEAMGPLRFIGFYLGSGVLAALAYVASAPHSLQPLVGASGAIAGVLAAYLMFRPCQKVSVFVPYVLLWLFIRPVVRIDAYWVLGGWILLQFWDLSSDSRSDVAYMAHVGGFIAGGAAFPLMRYRVVKLFQCVRSAEEAAPPL